MKPSTQQILDALSEQFIFVAGAVTPADVDTAKSASTRAYIVLVVSPNVTTDANAPVFVSDSYVIDDVDNTLAEDGVNISVVSITTQFHRPGVEIVTIVADYND